jgi:hypothetical protein
MYQLRPLSVGEILDGSFTIYRRHFAPLFWIAVLCMGPGTVLRIYLAMAGGPLAHPVLFLVGSLVTFFGSLIAAGATLQVISDIYLDRPADVSQALEDAVEKSGRLFAAGLVVGMLSALAAILFIVPGIIVWCGFALVSQIIILEDLSSMDALRRSRELTRGFKGKVFGVAAVIILILMVPAFAMGALLSQVTGEVAAELFGLLLTPLFSIVFTMLYYDLRVRKEGLDLELLARLTGEQPAA